MVFLIAVTRKGIFLYLKAGSRICCKPSSGMLPSELATVSSALAFLPPGC